MTEEKPKYIRKKCEHGRYSFQCKDCNGSSICSHNTYKSICKLCNGGVDFIGGVGVIGVVVVDAFDVVVVVVVVVVINGMIAEEKLGKGDRVVVVCDCVV
jgi:hypothetical protein